MSSKKPIPKPRQSIISKKRAKRITKRQLQELEDFSNDFKNLHKTIQETKSKTRYKQNRFSLMPYQTCLMNHLL